MAMSIGKVDRKIFGVQSELLRCKNPEDFDQVKEMGKQWLQPRHFSEIVEERSMEGICGYPACSKKINKNASTSIPTLRISYKEKRLYEVDGSVKFCCSACLKLAASYEASLEDTNPAGRDVAQALLENIESLEEGSVLDGQQRQTSPPKFRHELLDTAGAAKGTKETITAISTALRTYQDDDKGRKGPSPAAIPKTSLKAKSSHLMSSSLGALPILKYKQKEDDSAGGGSIAPPPSSSNESETTKSKVVSFSSGGMNKIVEKPAVTVCEMITTGHHQHQQKRDADGGITSDGSKSSPGSVTAPPRPDLGSPFVNADKMVRESPLQLLPPLSSPQSVQNDANGSSSREDIENISSLVKRIDFAPTEGIPSSDSAATERSDGTADAIIAVVEESENNEDESWAANDAAIISDRRDTSLFMLLWTALDDLFGNGKCGALLSADTLNFPESSSMPVVTVSGESRAMQRSTAQFIERGFAMAESHIKLDSFLPDAACVYYRSMKRTFLSCAELDKVCPSLSSTEWALLALLVVDALVCSKNVLPASDTAARQAWNQEMELCAGSILRKNTGRRRKVQHQQLSLSLRDGDLTLLRSFFPRLME